MKSFAWACVLLLVSLIAQAQEHRSPYSGRQEREIKALSMNQVKAYLEGQGAELALAAELNHYPGPVHALEFAALLNLTAVQKAQTEKVRAAVLDQAKRLGRLIVENEKELDRLFAEEKIDESGLRKLVRETARLQGELRNAHLGTHLEMKRILTPEQVRRYDELRGYTQAGVKRDSHEHRSQ